MNYICKACTKVVQQNDVITHENEKMHVSGRSSPGGTQYYCGPLEEDDLYGQAGLIVYT